MIITLYQQYKYDNNYIDVPDNAYGSDNGTTYHDRYLASLTKVTYEIDDVYMNNKGNLPIDLILSNTINFFNYTYMKVSYNNFYRYFFITDCTVTAGLVVFSYEEDIWSNYQSSIEFRKSLLTQSNLLAYGKTDSASTPSVNLDIYKLPLEYNGNNNLTKIRYGQMGENPKNVNIWVQLQTYTTGTSGETTDRETTMCKIVLLNSSGTEITDNFNLATSLDICYKLIKKTQTTQTIESQKYFEIGKIYILPHEIGNIGYVEGGTYTIHSSISFSYLTYSRMAFTISSGMTTPSTYENLTTELLNVTIPNNFKRLSIGTYNHQIPLVNNGKDIILKIIATYLYTDFKLILSVGNKEIDITSDFEVSMPISVLSAESTQLQNLTRSLQKQYLTSSLTTKIITGITGFAGSVASADAAGAISYSTSTINDIITSLEKEKLLNAEFYSSTNGNDGKIEGAINAYNGIFSYIINSNNDNEVTSAISQYGYNVYKYTNYNAVKNLLAYDYSQILLNGSNYIKYTEANIIASAPQNTINKLKMILERGVRIHYV